MRVRPPFLTGSNKELMTGIMYSDFFDAPRTVEKPVGKSKKAKVMEPKGKKGKKGKGVTFDEEEDEKDVADDAREVMGRFKEDLFADDEEEEVENDQRMSSSFLDYGVECSYSAMSTFEKRQKALADQIAQYEQEAVGPKDWTLLGEASSRARPENSLLEEDLDFEHVRKATPVITEEVVKSLEELIKKRILDVSHCLHALDPADW
jgi:U3 small nucleolar RNA-associated protein MPP10